MGNQSAPPATTAPPAPSLAALYGDQGRLVVAPTPAQTVSTPAPQPTGGTVPDLDAESPFLQHVNSAIASGVDMGKAILFPKGATETERIKNIAHGMIEQPDIEQTKKMKESHSRATDQRKAGHPVQAVLSDVEAGGHALAHLPLVGPWAASVAEKVGTEAGEGKYQEALGDLAGNIAMGKALDQVNDIAETGAGKVVSHLGETAKNVLSGAGEEVGKAATAKAPEGSTEAGAVKISKKTAAAPIKQNPAVGYINPEGGFEEFNQKNPKPVKKSLQGPKISNERASEATHEDFAANRNTDVESLMNDGWVRKAGQGSYQVGELNPKTKSAIEKDIISDYGDLTRPNIQGHRVENVVVDTNKGTFEFSPEDFIDKHNGDLARAMAPKTDFSSVSGKKISEPAAEVSHTGNANSINEVKLKQNGEDIAALHFTHDGDTASVNDTWVDDGLRGQKYGQRLITESAAKAKANGAKEFTSDPNGETSPSAQQAWNALVRKGVAEKTEFHPDNLPENSRERSEVLNSSEAGIPRYRMDLTSEPTPTDFSSVGGKPVDTPQQKVISEALKLNNPDQAHLDLGERDGRVRIKALETNPEARQKGHASRLLSSLTDLADKHGVPLELTSSPYAPLGFTDGILDSSELDAFYQRHGFVREGEDPAYGYMVREPKSSNADILESQQAATYHPDLQKVADKYGVSDDASKVRNGASFLAPDGHFIHLGSVEHPDAIRWAGSGSRENFISDTGAIRLRFSRGRAGDTLHVSVPEQGVTSEQVDGLKDAVHSSMGKYGNIVMEVGTPNGASAEEQFVNANAVEPMLKKIGAHPEQVREAKNGTQVQSENNPARHDEAVNELGKNSDTRGKGEGAGGNVQIPSSEVNITPSNGESPSKENLVDEWHDTAGKNAATEEAGGIDPRTGKSDSTGKAVEIMPELRQPLDHAPTATDFKNFYDQHKDIFDKNPELRVGWDNKSAAQGGHEINVGAVGDEAARVAKKLDQKSAFDIAKGEVIPTGGEGLRTDFPNYPLEERLRDLRGENPSDIKGFEHLSPDVYNHLEPDERAYLDGNKTLQRNVMSQYHRLAPSIPETINAMQAGAALGGWWQRYIGIFHSIADGGEAEANAIGPSHAEILKQWHAALSGNKSVQDANNLAWHSYRDWLVDGKPTDRASIDAIIRKNGAQPEGSGKKGNAAISDTVNKKGKVLSPGLDTTKLFNLVNSPEMKGERPFDGDVFNDDEKNPLMGTTEGARKIPSMGATVAGTGNLNRLVIDAHIRDFYGRANSGGPAAQYIADSAHLRQAAEALGLKGGEGQEQLWGTVLGLKTLLKEGLTPAEAGSKLNSDVINGIGKDYAEVIANDPEISAPGGLLDQLKEKFGIGRGSAGVSEANRKVSSTSAGKGKPAGGETPVNQTLSTKTAERILGQISETKIKKPAATPVQEVPAPRPPKPVVPKVEDKYTLALKAGDAAAKAKRDALMKGVAKLSNPR